MERRVAPDRGIVDEDVEAAIPRHRRIDERLGASLGRQIREHTFGGNAFGRKQSIRLLDAVAIALGVHHDARALAAEHQRGGAPDIACRAGDDGDAAVE